MAFIQKKRENLRIGSRTTAAVFCVLLSVFMMTGCGKVEEPIPVDLSSGNMEELQNDSTGENKDDPEEALEGDIGSDSEDDTNEKAVGDTENDTAENAGKNDSPDENIQQAEETQPHSVGSAELDGDIRSIGVDSFVVGKAETWTEGDSQFIVSAAPGYEEEEKLVTVYVDPNCVWEFKTVKNGGINPEDISTREGSFADLKEGMMINSKGSWQDDGSFLADSIVMMIFV